MWILNICRFRLILLFTQWKGKVLIIPGLLKISDLVSCRELLETEAKHWKIVVLYLILSLWWVYSLQSGNETRKGNSTCCKQTWLTIVVPQSLSTMWSFFSFLTGLSLTRACILNFPFCVFPPSINRVTLIWYPQTNKVVFKHDYSLVKLVPFRTHFCLFSTQLWMWTPWGIYERVIDVLSDLIWHKLELPWYREISCKLKVSEKLLINILNKEPVQTVPKLSWLERV